MIQVRPDCQHLSRMLSGLRVRSSLCVLPEVNYHGHMCSVSDIGSEMEMKGRGVLILVPLPLLHPFPLHLGEPSEHLNFFA